MRFANAQAAEAAKEACDAGQAPGPSAGSEEGAYQRERERDVDV